MSNDLDRVTAVNLDRLTRLAGLALISWDQENRRELGELPTAWQERLRIHAVIAYLLAQDLIQATPGPAGADGVPLEYAAAVPPRLRPDIAGELARYRRMCRVVSR